MCIYIYIHKHRIARSNGTCLSSFDRYYQNCSLKTLYYLYPTDNERTCSFMSLPANVLSNFSTWPIGWVKNATC